MDAEKNYQVKWLDFKYLANFDHLNFQYLTYDVVSQTEIEAIEKARHCYMKGQKEVFSEELPFVLKLFSVIQKPE